VIVIVSGLSGSGKTTVGMVLADKLGWPFADADTFHSQANIAKMSAGIPLTDADRAPWLRAVGHWMDVKIAAGHPGVITCSALKRVYRDALLDGRPAASMIFLEVSRDELARRLLARHGHFFHENMLDSQFAAFEPPAANERVHLVREEGGPQQTAADIMTVLWPDAKTT